MKESSSTEHAPANVTAPSSPDTLASLRQRRSIGPLPNQIGGETVVGMQGETDVEVLTACREGRSGSDVDMTTAFLSVVEISVVARR